MPTFLLALASIVISVAAQFTFKVGARQLAAASAAPNGSLAGMVQGMASNPWVLGGFLLYGIGAVIWLSVLARWDVSKAYPLVGLGFVITLAVGWMAGEMLTPLRVAGALCICLGVGLISQS
jgi:drug/metabolite transporter (DMT)-like permease